jgi:hypothetical protein
MFPLIRDYFAARFLEVMQDATEAVKRLGSRCT